MYTPKLALPSPSLAGISFETQVRLLDETGWGGIEVFLFPTHAAKLASYRAFLVKEYPHIKMSLHQPWSRKTSGGAVIMNWILALLGYLPKDGFLIASTIEHATTEVLVCYAEYFAEIMELRKNSPVDFALQTGTLWNGVNEYKKHRMSYGDFIKVVRGSTLPIVFDTYHVLEWKLNAPGSWLHDFSEEQLSAQLINAWNEIGHERIIEIHWNDFRPNALGVDERGCLPGDGKLSLGLHTLAQTIVESDWHGQIVPEVHPLLLLPRRKERMRALSHRMQQFFS